MTIEYLGECNARHCQPDPLAHTHCARCNDIGWAQPESGGDGEIVVDRYEDDAGAIYVGCRDCGDCYLCATCARAEGRCPHCAAEPTEEVELRDSHRFIALIVNREYVTPLLDAALVEIIGAPATLTVGSRLGIHASCDERTCTECATGAA